MRLQTRVLLCVLVLSYLLLLCLSPAAVSPELIVCLSMNHAEKILRHECTFKKRPKTDPRKKRITNGIWSLGMHFCHSPTSSQTQRHSLRAALWGCLFKNKKRYVQRQENLSALLYENKNQYVIWQNVFVTFKNLATSLCGNILLLWKDPLF